MAIHNEIGRIGEQIAADYLIEHGYTVIEQNFRRPYGEIDIVARETQDLLVFVEVKSVSWETSRRGDPATVTHETHRPEDNVHPQKLKRLSRTIESYMLTKRYTGNWRFDVMAVYIDQTTRRAHVRHLKDIVIGS
jgi:putative endonuclease